jgi:hypothetical protein
MRINKIWLAYITLILLISPVLTLSLPSKDNTIPEWNKEWSFKQEIKLPISTCSDHTKYQPIDLYIEFINPCWAKNENEHSIRLCSWDGYKWHELESQIYKLETKNSNHISSCRLVFLIPSFANGEELYYIFYDDKEKLSPNYIDHLSIEDAFYYYEPISGFSIESDFYQITEDGYCVYGIGQKGKILWRWLSQGIVKMKPQSKKFDIANFDNLASFCFSYQHGKKDEDEISSDQVLLSKEINVDGNLMVQFKIISESRGKNLRTDNIYKYYYCPTDDKRIFVHVKHQVFKGDEVTGIINVDGRYGALASVHSKSGRIKKMRFGNILPFMHIYSENDIIKEYKLNTDPENKEREWIVPYTDDCDLGEDAWISYDEGERGKAFGILFSSNKDIVKYGTDERDGIQVKVAEREYLNILGTEVDYAAINFGRNSFEKGEVHDRDIAGDLIIEYDAEFYTSEEGGYKSVILESECFRELIKYRQDDEDDSNNGEKNIYTLTVFPNLIGRFLNYPIFTLSADLFQNNEFVTKGEYFKPFLGSPLFKFRKIAPGEYVVKVFRRIGNRERIIGISPVKITEDKHIHISCSWQKDIKITALNQNKKRIENIELAIFQDDSIIYSNITKNNKDLSLLIPFNLFKPYVLKAYYKGFKIYDKIIPKKEREIDLILDLYDLTIDVKDKIGFSPGVNLKPLLTSSKMDIPLELSPLDSGNGGYVFNNLPAAKYKFYISYARFSDERYIDIPEDGDSANIKFTALFDLSTKLLDSRGDSVQNENLRIDIMRNGETLFDSVSQDKVVTLPPGKYIVKAHLDGKIVGMKTVELSNDKDINIVTKIKPLLPLLISGLVLVFICEIVVLMLIKKFSLNTFLKLLALALVFLAIFQPWWTLNGSSDTPLAKKNTEMYIVSGTMIEKVKYNEETYLELATLPEMFTNFLGILLLIIYSGVILLSISFIPNILLRKRYFLILISASIIFLLLVSAAFSYGMSKITELTLGVLNGEANLDVMLPNGEMTSMLSSWGLGIGFYLCVIASIILFFAGIIDSLKGKKWPKKIFKRK